MTSDRLSHPLIRDYLRDLEEVAALLPRQTRSDLVAEIRAHLHEGLTRGTQSDADIRNLLDELGDPRVIVAAARPEPDEPVTSKGPGGREVAAILLVLGGGIVLPIVGWLIGAALLWWSKAWTPAQKLLGTLVIPGGLLVPVLLLSLTSPVQSVALGVPLIIALVVAPITVAAHLWRSAARRPA